MQKANRQTTERSYFREEQDQDVTNYLCANMQTQPPRDSAIFILQIPMAFLWLSNDVKEHARKQRWDGREKKGAENLLLPSSYTQLLHTE